jgi:hypothetical protein
MASELSQYAVPVGLVLLGAGLASYEMRKPAHANPVGRHKGKQKEEQPHHWRNGVGKPRKGLVSETNQMQFFDTRLLPNFPHKGIRDGHGRLLTRENAELDLLYVAQKPTGGRVLRGGRR